MYAKYHVLNLPSFFSDANQLYPHISWHENPTGSDFMVEILIFVNKQVINFLMNNCLALNSESLF